jgi:hypothetical protein
MTELQKIAAKHELRALLDGNEITQGMTVRVERSAFVLGRPDLAPPGSPFSSPEPDDRLRLAELGRSRFTLSVRRHTGRWEKTPFTGTLPELIRVICATMQHLVAAW